MKMSYKDLYLNIIREKCPEKLHNPTVIWKLEHLNSSINIIELNDLLFHDGKRERSMIDSRLRCYTEAEIIRILKYQVKYNKTNTEIVNKFGMTRTTLYTWKKRFQNQLLTPIM